MGGDDGHLLAQKLEAAGCPLRPVQERLCDTEPGLTEEQRQMASDSQTGSQERASVPEARPTPQNSQSSETIIPLLPRGRRSWLSVICN